MDTPNKSATREVVSTERRKRWRFTPEFRSAAVRLVREGRKRLTQVAKDLDLPESALRNWVREADGGEGKESVGALSTAEREELVRLCKEVRHLEMERDFLKKRRPSSRRRPRGEVRAHRRAEGPLAHRLHVPAAGRFALGLLRLEERPAAPSPQWTETPRTSTPSRSAASTRSKTRKTGRRSAAALSAEAARIFTASRPFLRKRPGSAHFWADGAGASALAVSVF